MGAGGIQFSSRASSALAAVSIVLILLYLFWRFIWQIKKNAASSTGAAAATSPSSSSSGSLPSCPREDQAAWRARETSPSPLPMFVRVEMPAAGGCSGVEKVDCAVCLGELGDGQAAARLVPGCGHGFHVECIEAWFRVNTTCPLCRAAVAAAGQGAGGGVPQCDSV
ncbi:hypothetical protein EJB05_06709, partial [Eragrostis curvula]